MINVLLVDDEAISRQYIRSLIDWESNGFYLMAEAQSVEEALKQLKSLPIQLILMDVYMPGLNGIDLSRIVSEQYKDMMMIAVSSFDNYDYVREILKNGAHDYILKHRLNKDSLLAILNSAKSKMQSPMAMQSKAVEQHKLVKEWLLDGKECPFPVDGSRLTVTVVYLPDKEIDSGLQSTLASGIINILETCSDDKEQEIMAVYFPPRAFVVCTRFKRLVMEAKIQNALCFNNIKSQNNIQLLYKISAVMINCPPSYSRKKLPEYVAELINRQMGVEPPCNVDDIMGLSITEQKQILTALEAHNIPTAEAIISGRYARIEENDHAAKLLVTKSLFEILTLAAHEYKVELNFFEDVEEWYRWVQQKSPTEISTRMVGLYRQIISETTPVTKKYSPIINQANEFVNQYYGNNISLHDIAKAIGVSSSYLSRLYRQETGTTVIENLNRVRIEASKVCMQNGHSLKETAFVCGFARYNYFFKVFRDYEGMTPKDYMAQNEKR